MCGCTRRHRGHAGGSVQGCWLGGCASRGASSYLWGPTKEACRLLVLLLRRILRHLLQCMGTLFPLLQRCLGTLVPLLLLLLNQRPTNRHTSSYSLCGCGLGGRAGGYPHPEVIRIRRLGGHAKGYARTHRLGGHVGGCASSCRLGGRAGGYVRTLWLGGHVGGYVRTRRLGGHVGGCWGP